MIVEVKSPVLFKVTNHKKPWYSITTSLSANLINAFLEKGRHFWGRAFSNLSSTEGWVYWVLLNGKRGWGRRRRLENGMASSVVNGGIGLVAISV